MPGRKRKRALRAGAASRGKEKAKGPGLPRLRKCATISAAHNPGTRRPLAPSPTRRRRRPRLATKPAAEPRPAALLPAPAMPRIVARTSSPYRPRLPGVRKHSPLKTVGGPGLPQREQKSAPPHAWRQRRNGSRPRRQGAGSVGVRMRRRRPRGRGVPREGAGPQPFPAARENRCSPSPAQDLPLPVRRSALLRIGGCRGGPATFDAAQCFAASILKTYGTRKYSTPRYIFWVYIRRNYRQD